MGGRTGGLRNGEVDVKGEGDVSGCLQGGVIPSCEQVIASNCVLMRLHAEDNNRL